MNAGLPGTGLGGLFYIASALFMPVHRIMRGDARDGRSWQRVLTLSGIAAGILFAVFATGWLLGFVLTPASATATQASGTAALGAAARPVQNVVRWVAIVGTAGVLAGVLLLVEIGRFFVPRRPRGLVAPMQAASVAVRRLRPEAELSEVA